MKKLTVLSLSILLGMSAFAQTKIGLKVSPNFSWSQTIPNGDSLGVGIVEPNGLKLRGGAGVIVDIGLSDNFAVATGIDYMTKGAGYKFTFNNGSADTTVTANYALQYVQIPVGIKVFTNEIMDYTKMYFQVGVTQNVNIGAKVNGSKTYKDGNGATQPYTKDINLLETSLNIGTGIEMEMGESTAFVAGITYNRGLFNIDATDTFEKPNKLTNQYISLDLGLKF